LKRADGIKVILELEELQEIGDSLVLASKKLDNSALQNRADTCPTLRLLCQSYMTNAWE
jgi:hypothetical protein